jgi:hypothetical protein
MVTKFLSGGQTGDLRIDGDNIKTAVRDVTAR